jgi:hypothetical protein
MENHSLRRDVQSATLAELDGEAWHGVSTSLKLE